MCMIFVFKILFICFREKDSETQQERVWGRGVAGAADRGREGERGTCEGGAEGEERKS